MSIRAYDDFIKKIKSLKSYLNTGIVSSDEPEKVQAIIYRHLKNTLRTVEWCKLLTENGYILNNMEEVGEYIEGIITNVLQASSLEEVREAAAEFNERYDFFERASGSMRDYCKSPLAREFMDNELGVYNLDMNSIDNITSAISSDKKLNVLSLECGKGVNENILKQNMMGMRGIDIKTYGMDIECHGVKEAKQYIDKVVYGKLKGSTISNNVFDIVFLNPRITVIAQRKVNGSIMNANEEYILNNGIRYLKPNGLLVFNIPFNALTPGMFLFLSKNYKDITVFKNSEQGTARREAKYVTIMGIKSSVSSYADEFERLNTLTYDNLPEEPEHDYELILPEEEIKFFRGSVLDESELDTVLLTDGLYEEFYTAIEKQSDPKEQAPLLPFNIGQIGLILSSGSLDGVVEENETTKHLIKGMTIKETSYEDEQTVDGNVVVNSSTQIIRNKVQITALSADGTIYNLV